MKQIGIRQLSVLVAALFACAAQAAIPADAERLGKELTPLGGEKAGNKDNSIPPWAGGEPPLPGWSFGKYRLDYWKHKDEKPLFSIDAANADKYSDKLGAGELAKLKQLKGYRMNIYPSHRSCTAPDFVAENTKKNPGFAHMKDGWILDEAYVPGVPFPIPASGEEIMLNAKMRYRGVGIDYKNTITTVSPRKGSTEWIKAAQELAWYMPWAKKGSTKLSTLPPIEWYFYFAYSTPAALAGQALAITMKLNEPGSETFYYFPGQRRVRRMPTYAYDSPQIGFENQYTMDEPSGFFGTIDRFNWKIVGKKELYVPYNDFGLYNFKKDFHETAKDDFIDPNARRYELHRVWVVEATVKPGTRHASPKRTFYVDEDSWIILGSDDYDSQGKIWKVREAAPIPIYELGGACDNVILVQHNLAEGRYVFDMHASGTGSDIQWLQEAKGPRYNASFYTSENLRAISDR